MNIQTKLFINGRFVDSAEGATIPVLNPHDNSKICDIAEGRAEDIDRAVAAANKAFPKWARMSSSERGRLLLKLADKIEENLEELAQIESLDTGHPIRDTRNLDLPRTIFTYRYFGGMADKVQGDVIPVEPGFLNYVLREPIGVVGSIVPWNFPIMFTGWKLGPALAAGNTIVMKPAEITPLTALKIAELSAEVGFPEGVINVVPGYGATAGQHLAEHPEVGKISFTGSTATGRRIVQASAGNLKRLHLELGGKGANIVFEDANIPAAIGGSAFAIFHNQGQACIAGSRILVQEKVADAFLDGFLKLTKSIRIGDPKDPETEMGPLTSKLHQERVLNYVKIAHQAGSDILTGGKTPDRKDLAAGCYVEPTVVTARPNDQVCMEEVFGPFVSVTTFKTEEEVVGIANATEYGLGGGLWTRDLNRAHRVAGQLVAGSVWVNSYKRVHPGSPFGGMRQSGYGREMGFEVMHQYTEPKSVWVNVDAQIPPFYKR